MKALPRTDKQGNSRFAKLVRFLNAPPPRDTHALVLSFVIDESRETLGSWEPEQVSAALAERIDQECSDLEDEISCQVNGHLSWVDKSGVPIAQKPLRLRPAETSHLEFAGTNLDQARQAQKHLEAMTRVFVGSMHDVMTAVQSTLATQNEIMTRMSERVEDTEEREQGASTLIDALQDEINKLREELAEASEAKGGNENQDRIMRLLEGAITAQVLKAS